MIFRIWNLAELTYLAKYRKIVRASVPERLALPACNVAVGSVFNLDFSILYVLHGNKELILSPALKCCQINSVSLNRNWVVKIVRWADL